MKLKVKKKRLEEELSIFISQKVELDLPESINQQRERPRYIFRGRNYKVEFIGNQEVPEFLSPRVHFLLNESPLKFKTESGHEISLETGDIHEVHPFSSTPWFRDGQQKSYRGVYVKLDLPNNFPYLSINGLSQDTLNPRSFIFQKEKDKSQGEILVVKSLPLRVRMYPYSIRESILGRNLISKGYGNFPPEIYTSYN